MADKARLPSTALQLCEKCETLGSWVSRVQQYSRFENGESRENVFFSPGKNGKNHLKRRQRVAKKYNVYNEPSTKNGFVYEFSATKERSRENESQAEPTAAEAAQLLEEYIRHAEELKAEGNEALRRGDAVKAEKLYSEGMQFIMGNGMECRHLVSRLLTNRAAAHMHQSNISLALLDCRDAQKIYPKNIRAYTRAATCHVRMGQFQKSKSILERALQMLNASDPQFRTVQDQMRLTQDLKRQLEEISVRCGEGDIDDDLLKTVESLREHLCRCDKFWRLAALTYLQSTKFSRLENALERVQDLLHDRETTDADLFCWWQWMKMESLWWNPQQSHGAVTQQVQVVLESMQTRSLIELETTPQTESLTQVVLQGVMRQMHEANMKKDAGNQAMARTDYDQACEHYSDAIGICEAAGSPATFLSVLYCNRGAALHGSGCYIEALGDVCIALCLNPFYAKAYLRLAQMHLETFNAAAAGEILAACETQHLQLSEQDRASFHSLKMSVGRMEKASRKLDAYKLMGVSRDCQNSAVKKAFKKLALKLHPDKACHTVKLNLSWMQEKPAFVKSAEKRIRDALHDHMQHLFKLLNSANSALSDPIIRGKLDQDLHRKQGTSPFPSPRNAYRTYPYDSYAYYYDGF